MTRFIILILAADSVIFICLSSFINEIFEKGNNYSQTFAMKTVHNTILMKIKKKICDTLYQGLKIVNGNIIMKFRKRYLFVWNVYIIRIGK